MMLDTLKKLDFSFTEIRKYADWKLLLFLLLFLDVKMAVKVPAIIIIYLLQFDFSFRFSLKNSRLPLFYPLIIVIAIVDIALNLNYLKPFYLLVFFNGILFWVMCILAVHQVKLSVEKHEAETIHHTILLFFIINTAISLFLFSRIILETGAINPYRYQGEYQKYFIGTGDYIKGLTFDISTTNAVLSAFGVIYFLVRKNYGMALTSMTVLLLTGSNFINLSLLAVLLFLLVYKSTRDQKSIIVACFCLLVVFMAKISPQNNQYVIETVKNIIHPQKGPFKNIGSQEATAALTPEEIKRKLAQHYLDSASAAMASLNKQPINKQLIPVIKQIAKTEAGRILIPGPDINTKPYQTPTDTTPEQQKLLTFINENSNRLPISGEHQPMAILPGKAASILQTVTFFAHHPSKIISGNGIGNFSSKLAFRATGLGFAGGYPAKYNYINPDFFSNHLDLYLNFFSKNVGQHSLTNSPYAVYDQLLAEYGLLGLLAFAVFYLYFFVKHIKNLTYGMPLLIFLIPVLLIDYWFEQLSVIVFFELLLILNIKETTNKVIITNEH